VKWKRLKDLRGNAAMVERRIVNASPLILFSRIARLDLIEGVASNILIPNAVIDEVRAGQHKDPSATVVLEWAAKYRVKDVGASLASSIGISGRASLR
jgi:predicted nucleic acid-binding protein